MKKIMKAIIILVALAAVFEVFQSNGISLEREVFDVPAG